MTATCGPPDLNSSALAGICTIALDFEFELHLDVHPRDEGQARIRKVDLHPKRAGFRIDGFARAGDLALEDLRCVIDVKYFGKGAHGGVRGGGLGNVDEDPDVIELREPE